MRNSGRSQLKCIIYERASMSEILIRIIYELAFTSEFKSNSRKIKKLESEAMKSESVEMYHSALVRNKCLAY